MNPVFDVDMLLQHRIQTRKGKKVVVLCIADLFDFDASIPKLAMRYNINTQMINFNYEL